jgi:hypothetical protein
LYFSVPPSRRQKRKGIVYIEKKKGGGEGVRGCIVLWWVIVVHGKREDPFKSLSEVLELGKVHLDSRVVSTYLVLLPNTDRR